MNVPRNEQFPEHGRQLYCRVDAFTIHGVRGLATTCSTSSGTIQVPERLRSVAFLGKRLCKGWHSHLHCPCAVLGPARCCSPRSNGWCLNTYSHCHFSAF
ncbi:hypothetical protein M3J09_005222 [Ascochyta lentis]